MTRTAPVTRLGVPVGASTGVGWGDGVGLFIAAFLGLSCENCDEVT